MACVGSLVRPPIDGGEGGEGAKGPRVLLGGRAHVVAMAQAEAGEAGKVRKRANALVCHVQAT
jgi:hypothetical protein